MKRLVAAFLILACAGMAKAEVVDRIIAIVNDQIVTKSDLDAFRKKLKTKGLVDDALLNFYDVKLIQKDSKALLAYLIDEKLIDSALKREGIVSPIEKVEAEIRSILAKSGMSRDALKASLKKRGISYAEYQDFVKTSLERQTLLQREISSKIKISDDDIAAYYIQKKKDSKALVFEYQLAHILFLPSNGGAAEALQRAKSVKAKLATGGNFELLASQFSEDSHFTQGGVFGQVKISDVVPALQDALNGISVGETTDIVKMPDGYHIFKVLKRTLVPSPEFERVRNEIANVLFVDAFKQQYEAWIEVQRQNAYVKLNVDKNETL